MAKTLCAFFLSALSSSLAVLTLLEWVSGLNLCLLLTVDSLLPPTSRERLCGAKSRHSRYF